MSLTDSINNIRAHLSTAESELTSLQAGKKASSGRARKSLQQIKQLSHLLRKQIIEHTKALPTKKRTAIVAEEPEKEPAQAVPLVEEPQAAVSAPAPKKKRIVKSKPIV